MVKKLHKRCIILLTGLLLFTVSCRKGDFTGSTAPDTKLSVEAINLTGDNRLNSSVKLSWFGTDADGFITGFEISFDNQNWSLTTAYDSTFLFAIPPGSDTADIDFYVRAIDNDEQRDPSPAYIKVPLKNAAPQAFFDDDRSTEDTAFVVSTFNWNATDADGSNTIQQVFIKFNEGEWFEIDKNQKIISFLADTTVQSGAADASVYYGTSSTPISNTISGLQVAAQNTLYIKAVDLAGAESEIDTSNTFWLKNKTPGVNTLWVTGHLKSETEIYRGFLNNQNIAFDFLNYGKGNGVNMPKFWDPTFKLTLSLYKKLIVTSTSTKYTNPVTGNSSRMLSFMAPLIQPFFDRGGKLFVTTSFIKTDDISDLIETYPISGLITSNIGQARIYANDSVFPVVSGNYPVVSPASILIDVVPIVKSSDAQSYYRADLTPVGNWSGTDNLMATRRFFNGDLRQVFFAYELHKFDADYAKVEALIGQIIKNDF